MALCGRQLGRDSSEFHPDIRECETNIFKLICVRKVHPTADVSTLFTTGASEANFEKPRSGR
jgi:hypothetical protein